MPTCIALFCTHDSRRESCKMFKFPSNPDLKKQWLNNTRRSDINLKPSSRICSCHFVKGKKQYGPTIFAWTNYISKIRRNLDKEENILEVLPTGTVESVSTSTEPPLAIPIEDIVVPSVEIEVKTEEARSVHQPCKKRLGILSRITKNNKDDSSFKVNGEERFFNIIEESMQRNLVKEPDIMEKLPAASVETESTSTDHHLAIPVEDIVAPGLEIEVETEKRKNRKRPGILSHITMNKKDDSSFKAVKKNGEEKEVEDSRVNKNPRLVELRVDNLILKHEIEELEKEIDSLTCVASYQNDRLTIEKLGNNLSLLKLYTGLESFAAFHYIVKEISKSSYNLKYDKWSVVNMRLSDQLFMALMKLKTNYAYCDIAYRFRVSACTVKNVVWTFVDALYVLIYENNIKMKPFPCFIGSGITLPDEFINFSNCRIILGCFEIESEVSKITSVEDYKHKILKVMVGMSPLGNFIFVSDLYPENTSLREIVRKSGVLNKLSSGDLILSVEDLSIMNLLPAGVDLNVPLLMEHDVNMTKSKISSDITKATRSLHSAIRNVKEFAILNRILIAYRGKASKILQTCCALMNIESFLTEETDNISIEINDTIND